MELAGETVGWKPTYKIRRGEGMRNVHGAEFGPRDHAACQCDGRRMLISSENGRWRAGDQVLFIAVFVYVWVHTRGPTFWVGCIPACVRRGEPLRATGCQLGGCWHMVCIIHRTSQYFRHIEYSWRSGPPQGLYFRNIGRVAFLRSTRHETRKVRQKWEPLGAGCSVASADNCSGLRVSRPVIRMSEYSSDGCRSTASGVSPSRRHPGHRRFPCLTNLLPVLLLDLAAI